MLVTSHQPGAGNCIPSEHVTMYAHHSLCVIQRLCAYLAGSPRLCAVCDQRCATEAIAVASSSRPACRYRELWLWLVIPASILTFFFVKLQYLTTPLTLLPQKALAAYWNGHGELMTSAMRPFIQHMRLRPYVAYTLADAAMCVWVFAQLHGYWAAMWRWGPAVVLSISLCWGLDLHVRRRFVALQR